MNGRTMTCQTPYNRTSTTTKKQISTTTLKQRLTVTFSQVCRRNTSTSTGIRDLIFKEYFRVFRLRLGKDTAAHFEPMSVKTIPGAKLRKGYSINLRNLPKDALDSLHAQLKLNKSMGIVFDDVPEGSVLHSLLSNREKT